MKETTITTNSGKRIRIIGANHAATAAILQAAAISDNEADARIEIMNLIETSKIKDSILFDGNIVWNKRQIVNAAKRAMKDISKMTKALYEFCHLTGGDIAHYNKGGWCSYWGTFHNFLSETDRAGYQCGWATDQIAIWNEIYKECGVAKPTRYRF